MIMRPCAWEKTLLERAATAAEPRAARDESYPNQSGAVARRSRRGIRSAVREDGGRRHSGRPLEGRRARPTRVAHIRKLPPRNPEASPGATSSTGELRSTLTTGGPLRSRSPSAASAASARPQLVAEEKYAAPVREPVQRRLVDPRRGAGHGGRELRAPRRGPRPAQSRTRPTSGSRSKAARSWLSRATTGGSLIFDNVNDPQDVNPVPQHPRTGPHPYHLPQPRASAASPPRSPCRRSIAPTR